MLKRRDKSYVSELDQLLTEFDQKNANRSDSQRKEINKHQRIAVLRDNPQENSKSTEIWEGF